MTNSGMHDNEINISVDLVKRIVSEQFPQWSNLSINQIKTSGTDNALFLLGSEMLVRLPRIHWAFEGVAIEHEWLPRVASQLPVFVPSPLGLGKPSHEYPSNWSIYNWLDGSTSEVGKIEKPEELAIDLARFINAFQKVETDGAPISNRGQALIERNASTLSAIEELKGLIDTSAALQVWEYSLGISKWAHPSVWIHGDLSGGNILLSKNKLAGVIDFGAMGIGDPSGDLIIAWNLLPPSVRDIFRNELDVNQETWERGRGLALSIALIQLPYYKERNPLLAANALYVIHEVLADCQK